MGLTVAPRPAGDGIVVTNVDPNGVVTEKGIKTEDVILEDWRLKGLESSRHFQGDPSRAEGWQAQGAHASESGRTSEVRHTARRAGVTDNARDKLRSKI